MTLLNGHEFYTYPGPTSTKGYEQMTTQDLLEALQISRGAFYHYFESKQALLMALVERIGEQAEQLVLPMISDRQIPTQDKLLRFIEKHDEPRGNNVLAGKRACGRGDDDDSTRSETRVRGPMRGTAG